MTSFFVTRSQSRSISSRETPSSVCPLPSVVGMSNAKLSLKTGLKVLFFTCVFFFAIRCPFGNKHTLNNLKIAYELYFLRCREDKFWHKDQPIPLHPFLVDSLLSIKQQSVVQQLVASIMKSEVLLVLVTWSRKKKIIRSFKTYSFNKMLQITFKLLGWISRLNATCWFSIWCSSIVLNGQTTSPMTSSREYRSKLKTTKCNDMDWSSFIVSP